MDLTLLQVFITLSIVLGVALAASILLLFHLRNSYLSLKKKVNSISDRSYQIGDFIKFFAENVCSNLKGTEVYSTLAQKIASVIEAENVCIYTLSESKFFSPIGYTESFPLLFGNKKFVLSKPRFIIDALKHDKIDISDGILGEINTSREGLYIPDASTDFRFCVKGQSSYIRSFIGVPMMLNNSLVGVVCAINDNKGGMFNVSQFSLLESIVRIVSVIHQIIQSYVSSSKRDHLNQEIEFTRLLQKSLLPKEPPSWKPFEIYAYTRSAKEVSGDFYDFVPIDEDRLLVVLGDASGKGIPACMMMAMTRSFIRANAGRFTTLSELMLELNASLYRDTDEGRFTTVSCCVLDRKEQTVEFARAGHTEMIVFSSRQRTRMIRPHGAALGLLPTEMAGAYDSISFTFKPYYSILLFSDGISEALDKDGKEFGSERLGNVFYESCSRKNSPAKTVDIILRNLEELPDSAEISDDQTIVIIGHEESFI